VIKIGSNDELYLRQRYVFNDASASVEQSQTPYRGARRFDRGEAYEAKWGHDGYHGYRLDKEAERYQRECVLKAWSDR
jgi:hypothetical protein